MTTIDITNITGLTYPYNIYVCDIYGNNCILISTVFTTIPPSNTILLPPQFNTSPSVGIKIITPDGCEKFKIIDCNVLLPLPVCDSSVVPPITINGITITETHTGFVDTYLTAFTSCGTVTTPPNSIWLGLSGAFTYTMNFSSTVNNITIFMTGSGVPLDEIFVFTTNTGTGIPTITSNENCYTTIVGNQIISGADAPSGEGGGGKFLIHNSDNFTSLTISGDGGEAGSLFSICSNSII
jgi:hypothetical protein